MEASRVGSESLENATTSVCTRNFVVMKCSQYECDSFEEYSLRLHCGHPPRHRNPGRWNIWRHLLCELAHAHLTASPDYSTAQQLTVATCEFGFRTKNSSSSDLRISQATLSPRAPRTPSLGEESCVFKIKFRLTCLIKE